MSRIPLSHFKAEKKSTQQEQGCAWPSCAHALRTRVLQKDGPTEMARLSALIPGFSETHSSPWQFAQL